MEGYIGKYLGVVMGGMTQYAREETKEAKKGFERIGRTREVCLSE